MLTEMIGSEKLLACVAYLELVNLLEVVYALLPVLACGELVVDASAQHSGDRSKSRSIKFVATIAAYVRFARAVDRVAECILIPR